MAADNGIRQHDVAVVGLGLVGSGALRALTDEGIRCVGIGPAEPATAWRDHRGPFASHYDSGRITRHLDPVREWAVLAARSIAGYAELESRSGVAFHRPVGAVLGELDERRIGAIRAVAAELGVAECPPDERLSLPAGSTVLAEPAPAGHIDPRRMLAANLAVAVAGAAPIIGSAAVELAENDHGWAITTAMGDTVHAERVLLATGAHSDELHGLHDCPPLMVRGETIVMATIGRGEQQRLTGMPSVLARLDDPTYGDLYVVPPTDYPDGTVRLKLGATLRHHRRLHTGAARRAWMSGDAHAEELPALRALLEVLVPGLKAERWETKPCLITDTASGLPVVDHLAPHLVLAAGGNGFAAKSANAIGALAARLVVDGRWADADLDHRLFAATRIGDR